MKRKFNKSKKLNNPAKQRKSRLIMSRILFLTKLIIVMAFLSAFTWLYNNINPIIDEFYNFTGDLGFIVNNLTIEGQKYVTSERISKVIKIKPGMPIFSISLSSLKTRLESIDWIKYSIVERRLPDSLHIKVVERTPIALGQKNRKLYIIDDEGAIINDKSNIKNYLNLPIIIGDGAEIYANSLINTLKTEPELFKHITSIIRVSERRWNIRLDDKLEIKMPEEDFDKAWHIVIKLYKKNELLDDNITSLDLRIPNKIFVEKK